MVYTGRFAPSPTGPLHFGSLVTALASYLDARFHSGRWLLRIEDLDPPRETTRSAHLIIHQLNALGFVWDGDILFQSTRLAAYDKALGDLNAMGSTFPCVCSRNETRGVYSGLCRTRSWEDTSGNDFSIRARVNHEVITIRDEHLGEQTWNMQRDVGDFVVRRKDGLHAYQLAVVVDDAFQGITHVVRGNDLLSSTPRQLHLIRQLGYVAPSYLHLPVLTDPAGYKLSKQHHAKPVSVTNPVSVLRSALTVLGQSPQPGVDDKASLLDLAARDWKRSKIPRGSSITWPD